MARFGVHALLKCVADAYLKDFLYVITSYLMYAFVVCPSFRIITSIISTKEDRHCIDQDSRLDVACKISVIPFPSCCTEVRSLNTT